MTASSRRILCVLPALPDRTTGGGVLLYEILTHLVARDSVHVIVPVATHLRSDFETLANDQCLAAIDWHPLRETQANGLRGRLKRFVSLAPAEVAKFATEENRQILETARERCMPSVELLISSRAISPYRGFRLPADSRLYMMDIEPHIVRYEGPSLKRRIACAVERPKVDRLCRRALHRAGRVGAISALDVPELNRMGRRQDVQYVPPLMRPKPADRSRAEDFDVLITTNFTYPPNVRALEWFLGECWPHVDERARLTVTGKDEHDALARMCGMHPRVSYAGCVSREELESLFSRAAVAVNPTRTGSGFQIKLLEAIAHDLPIVSTGFSNRLGSAIASSDDPAELARLITQKLVCNDEPSFSYADLYRHAVAEWDKFLT